MSAPILVFAKRNPEIRADLTPSPGKMTDQASLVLGGCRESGFRVRLAVATKVAEAKCP